MQIRRYIVSSDTKRNANTYKNCTKNTHLRKTIRWRKNTTKTPQIRTHIRQFFFKTVNTAPTTMAPSPQQCLAYFRSVQIENEACQSG